jgi:uncharacterized protein YjbI with pentapeptide repeats
MSTWNGTKPTLSQLAAIVAAHALWLADSAGGIRADLSGADLSGLDLSDIDLRYADLRQVNFTGADISYDKLDSAKVAGDIITATTITTDDSTATPDLTPPV